MFKKSAAPSGYFLTKSLRFRQSASTYLNRTPGSTSNQQKWTLSFWVKPSTDAQSNNPRFLSAGSASGKNGFLIMFSDSYQFCILSDLVTPNTIYGSSGVYRDPASWYHIVVAVDTTQATAANRLIAYINGSTVNMQNSVSGWGSYTPFTQNYNTPLNTSGTGQWIGARGFYLDSIYDGQMAEVNFVDGQQLTASSFGSTNATTGVWQPAKYTGTYGTNGFYLPFTNTTSTTTLGYDSSGNSNNWTTNNFSLTAGSTYDSMTDVPTLTSATVANYCVLNAVNKGANINLTNGNLQYDNVTSDASVFGTFGMSSGKWYWEMTVTSSGNSCGIAAGALPSSSAPGGSATGYAYNYDGRKVNGGTLTAYGSSYTTGDVIGFAFDADAGTITCYKNNTSQGTMFSGLTSGPYFAAAGNGGSGAAYNFGQQGFKYTPPTGFVALNTYNLPTSTIVKGASYMNATLYNGNGGTQTIATGFQPDFTWIKVRNVADDHFLYDSNRGATLYLNSDVAGPEGTIANGLTAFTSTGFSLGDSGSTNNASNNFVAWNWQAGKGSNVSNTSGSITSTVSSSATAGFSIALYSGNSTSGATVGHGLGVAPSMIIVKRRNASLAQSPNWIVYHSSLGNTKALILDNTSSAQTLTGFWNNTTPSSSVFTVGNDANTNVTSFNYVAYCWAAIAGFSAFGSYTGNGSADGPFIYTGFRPKFIMIKRSDSTSSWYICDTSINTYNEEKVTLYPNLTNAEGTNANFLDGLSNGFKMRESGVAVNGATYVYAAFAENPFKNALAR